jgi:hypothetical protein
MGDGSIAGNRAGRRREHAELAVDAVISLAELSNFGIMGSPWRSGFISTFPEFWKRGNILDGQRSSTNSLRAGAASDAAIGGSDRFAVDHA